MKKLTYIFIIIFTTVFCSNSFGQVVKYKADAYSIKARNESTGRWPEWPEWKKDYILITFDLDKARIKVFSKREQVYDIIESIDKSVDEDGDTIYKFLCVDNDGLKCHLRIVKSRLTAENKQLYVEFNDYKWVYNIYSID